MKLARREREREREKRSSSIVGVVTLHTRTFGEVHPERIPAGQSLSLKAPGEKKLRRKVCRR